MNPENGPKFHVERKDTDTDMYRPRVDVLLAVQPHEYSLSVEMDTIKCFMKMSLGRSGQNLLIYFCLW